MRPLTALSGDPRVHGGPDAREPARWDFSTCSHPLGPNALALAAVRDADPMQYPDPGYTALIEVLAGFHGVAPERVLLAGSASEFIQRVTAVSGQQMPGPVGVPAPAYGDYAAAAQAWGRPVQSDLRVGQSLRWLGELRSPDGLATRPPESLGDAAWVLDRAYAPLALDGPTAWAGAAEQAVFQLWTPNKALGLCGVRAAYAIAPAQAAWPLASCCEQLRRTAPSWLLGAHGVAMLQAWVRPEVQRSLRDSLDCLAAQRAELCRVLQARGFEALPGNAPFVCLRVPLGSSAERLRARGIAVRDCTSFGLAGHWRLNALGGEALAALLEALDDA